MCLEIYLILLYNTNAKKTQLEIIYYVSKFQRETSRSDEIKRCDSGGTLSKNRAFKGSIIAVCKWNYEAKQLALHKLAVALNVSEVWLMGYDVPCERQIINASDFSEKEKIVILAYRKHPAMQNAVDTLLGIEKQPEKKLSPTVSDIKPKTYIVRTAGRGEGVKDVEMTEEEIEFYKNLPDVDETDL